MDAGNSRVLEYTREGELLNSWTVRGQDVSKSHGVQVAAHDARGRLLLLDKTSGRIIRLDQASKPKPHLPRPAWLPDTKNAQ